MIYLDYNATSPPRPEVLERAVPFITEQWGNPSSTHGMARGPAAAVTRARDEVAAWCGCLPRDVVFTAGATEANHLALRGLAWERLLVSAVEHPSVLAPALALGATIIPVTADGVVDLTALEALLAQPGRALVSVMAANNETGALQPIDAVAALVRGAGGLLHVDAAQLGGRLAAPTTWDALTVSGHKAGGLKGAGALALGPGLALRPQQLGGSQERGRRAGTVDVPAVVGLGCALSLPATPGVEALRDRLQQAATILGARITSTAVERLPNTLHLSFPGIPGEAVVAGLDLEGVCGSTGSACASGASEPSHVLEAMGGDPSGGVRLSLGWKTTSEEIEEACGALTDVITRHRQVAEELSWSV